MREVCFSERKYVVIDIVYDVYDDNKKFISF